MTPLTEESFRALVDGDGILRGDAAIDAPAPHDAFTVFAQRGDARLEIDGWTRHAAQFFDARLGLTVEKRYDAARAAPARDVARVVIAPAHDEAGGTRLCFARPRTEDDLVAAQAAEARMGPAAAGLASLAARCPHVWLVAVEGSDADDRAALRIAGVIASVVLGPILSPPGDAIFGVRTVRARLAAPRAT